MTAIFEKISSALEVMLAGSNSKVNDQQEVKTAEANLRLWLNRAEPMLVDLQCRMMKAKKQLAKINTVAS